MTVKHHLLQSDQLKGIAGCRFVRRRLRGTVLQALELGGLLGIAAREDPVAAPVPEALVLSPGGVLVVLASCVAALAGQEVAAGAKDRLCMREVGE